MTSKDNPGHHGHQAVENDAKGQFAESQADGTNNGVASAKPRVITHSDDATVNNPPPGEKRRKDWDVNYDPREMNEGNSQL